MLVFTSIKRIFTVVVIIQTHVLLDSFESKHKYKGHLLVSTYTHIEYIIKTTKNFNFFFFFIRFLFSFTKNEKLNS